MTNEIIAQAKEAVKGNWWRLVGTSIVLYLLVLIFNN